MKRLSLAYKEQLAKSWLMMHELASLDRHLAGCIVPSPKGQNLPSPGGGGRMSSCALIFWSISLLGSKIVSDFLFGGIDPYATISKVAVSKSNANEKWNYCQ